MGYSPWGHNELDTTEHASAGAAHSRTGRLCLWSTQLCEMALRSLGSSDRALGLLGHGPCLSYFTKLLRWAFLGLSFVIYTMGMMSAPNKSCKGDARQAHAQTPL